MSFVGKAVSNVVSGVGKALGLLPDSPRLPGVMPAPTLSNPDNSAATDKASQDQAARMTRGRTSTMLTGGAGEDEDKLNTSKVLLGQ